MNKVILMGRLTRDPEIRYSQNDNQMAIARYSLAVDRRTSRNNQNQDGPTADFFDCVAFGRSAEFAERYFHKGIKILVEGRLQNSNYTNKEGQKVYRTEIIVENTEFAESKSASAANSASFDAGSYSGSYSAPAAAPEGNKPEAGFINVPDGIDEELPFG